MNGVLESFVESVGAAGPVVAVGGRTQYDVGGPVDADARELTAPEGIVEHVAAEMTVRVRAGTTVADLDDALAPAGQCVALPAQDGATVGGVLAVGHSGIRRLGWGPVRDAVLEVRYVSAEGRLVKGGGPTVKNVSGYDVPRLLVGSLGTIGVLTEVTLRCRPLPLQTAWFSSAADPFEIRARTFRPSAILWDGRSSWTLLEGHADDVEAERRRADLVAADGSPAFAPAWPDGPHRGRISVRPARVADVGDALARTEGLRWLAEVGVGTVHVAADDPLALAAARAVAESAGGWLLREAGAPDLDGFGAALPNAAVMARIKDAFDPTGKLSLGRLPLPVPEPAANA